MPQAAEAPHRLIAVICTEKWEENHDKTMDSAC
jgi:hypothetical protein